MPRHLIKFERKLPLFNKLKSEFRRQARAETESWASVASTLLNFQQNAVVVSWTKDWRQRESLTTTHLVSVIAAAVETFHLKQAHAAIAQAVEMENAESSESADLIFIWAGLEAVQLGRFDRALSDAQRVNPHNLNGWYALGYRLLASAVEAQAKTSAELTRPEQTELLRYFTPGRFPIEPQFAKDRISRWYMLCIQAQLAGQLGWRIRKIFYLAHAWWVQTQ